MTDYIAKPGTIAGAATATSHGCLQVSNTKSISVSIATTQRRIVSRAIPTHSTATLVMSVTSIVCETSLASIEKRASAIMKIASSVTEVATKMKPSANSGAVSAGTGTTMIERGLGRRG